MEVGRADAGGLTDAEELCEREESEAGGASLGGGCGPVGKVEEEVGVGPQLDGWWGSNGPEGAGHAPVEGGDCGSKESQGLELPDSREEATGCNCGAGVGGHVVQDGGDDFSMGDERAWRRATGRR